MLCYERQLGFVSRGNPFCIMSSQKDIPVGRSSKVDARKALTAGMRPHLHVCCPPVKAISTNLLLQGGTIVCEPPAQCAIPPYRALAICRAQTVQRLLICAILCRPATAACL